MNTTDSLPLGSVVVSEDDLGDLSRIQRALHGFWVITSHPLPSVIDSHELALLIEPHVHKMGEIMKRIYPAE